MAESDIQVLFDRADALRLYIVSVWLARPREGGVTLSCTSEVCNCSFQCIIYEFLTSTLSAYWQRKGMHISEHLLYVA